MTDGTGAAQSGGTIPPDGGRPGSDPALDRIVGLLADLFDVPMALLVVDGGDGAVVRAAVGLDEAALSRVGRLCRSLPPKAWSSHHLVLDAAAERHPRGRLPPTGLPPVRFMAGVPLPAHGGGGLLCALDRASRPAPSARAMEGLATLAAMAADALDRGRREAGEVSSSSDILAELSHELRTSVTGIVGFAELLGRGGGLDGDRRRTVERIGDAGRGLLDIIDGALDVARHGSGGLRLKLSPFSPSRLIEDAVAMVRPDAARKGLPLVIELPRGKRVAVLGDQDRLRQVVLNLLSNAIKFTASGSVRVRLTMGAEPAPHGAPVPVEITVEDSGIGMVADSIPRLFRRFAQADDSVAHRFGGTGLGLAISKRLVEAMGGTIAVESAPGAGSRFRVALALAPASAPTRAGDARRPPRSSLDGVLKGLRILLAEDTASNQRLVAQMLAPLGAEIEVVEDGLSAVAAVLRRDYAMVFMDVEMPILGGLDAARRIRALDGARSELPIVALTGHVTPERLDLCRQAGMDDHLTKPFGADDLVAKALSWTRGAVATGR